MKLGVYYITSATDSGVTAGPENQEFLKQLEKECGVQLPLVPKENLSQYDQILTFVGSGGTEGIFKQIFSLLPQPILLLTTGKNNSLAASMEILSYLRQQNAKGEILHGSIPYVAGRIKLLTKVLAARKKIRSMTIGRIGKPSDWLIASDVDNEKCRQQTGIRIVDIPMPEFFAEIDKKSYESNQWTDLLKTKNWPAEEVEKALWVYGAAKRLVVKYGLQGVTVRCFDILVPYKTSGCAALAILNAEGIYAGCEGDTPGLISMAVLGELTGQHIFMANPSRILTDSQEIVFAHCTLPLDMPLSFTCMTHFESGQGLAFRGKLPLGPLTIFKCSGLMDRYFAAAGTLEENLCEERLCRTQLRIKMKPEDLNYFLTDSIGNHHLIAVGDHTEEIREFFKWF